MKPDPLTTDETQDKLLRLMERHREAVVEPQRVGASFFFEVRNGWEVRALVDDLNVRKVYTASGLEDAFHDQTVRTILVPQDATITRTIAMRVCARHGRGKTVFFEIVAAD